MALTITVADRAMSARDPTQAAIRGGVAPAAGDAVPFVPRVVTGAFGSVDAICDYHLLPGGF